MFNKPALWLSGLAEAIKHAKCEANGEAVSLDIGLQKCQLLFKTIRSEGRNIWWVGNGGSAAMCTHLSQDILNKLKIKSFVLADAPLLTCISNDYGYENIYARPLETLVGPGDLLVAISSSGNSANILNCIALANERGLSTITLSGFDKNNKVNSKRADVSIYVQSQLYGIVEVAHEAILHSAIESLWLTESNPSN